MMSLTNLSLLPELAAVEVPADVVNEDAEAVEPVCAEKENEVKDIDTILFQLTQEQSLDRFIGSADTGNGSLHGGDLGCHTGLLCICAGQCSSSRDLLSHRGDLVTGGEFRGKRTY